MATGSPQQSQSAEAARFNQQQAQNLANLALPEISSTLTSVMTDLNSARGTGIPDSVRQQYQPIIDQTNQDYAMAGRGQSAYIAQAARQSGNIYNSNAISDTLLSAGQTLEQSRRSTQQNIAYNEAVSGLQEYNNLLDVMGGLTSESLSLGAGFMGGAGSAIGMLPNTSIGSAALSGAASGASLGTTVSPGWGTLIGAAAGAGAGALTYGG